MNVCNALNVYNSLAVHFHDGVICQSRGNLRFLVPVEDDLLSFPGLSQWLNDLHNKTR